MIKQKYNGNPCLLLGTGPSLTHQADAIRNSSLLKAGVNNTFMDFKLDYHCATDPDWWMIYHREFKQKSKAVSFTHNESIAKGFGIEHFRCVDKYGLSTDPNVIHHGHSSLYQLLNILFLMGAGPFYLCGFDMKYEQGKPRHYFDNLSDKPGEYPEPLRKHSPFEGRDGKSGVIKYWESISGRGYGFIKNCTKDSAVTCFPFAEIPC